MTPEHLKYELEVAGLRLTDSSEHAAFLQELMHLLQPEVHEGKIVSCGCVSISSLENLGQIGRIVEQSFPVEMARRLADGVLSFVAMNEGRYAGLLVLNAPCYEELALLSLRAALAGYVAVTDSFGQTKIMTDNGILIHELRRWRKKPPVTQAIDNLQRHFSAVRTSILQIILSFCYYTLSPANTGATIVWYVAPPSVDARASAPTRTDAAPLGIDFSAGSGLALAHALFARTDGAALVDPEGRMLGFEVQLGVSDRSRAVIPQASGTRRTSARRYSYDHPEAIVFTVSADGPVRIFSDGMEVAQLSLIDPGAFAQHILSVAREYDRDDASVDEYEHICESCGKTSVIIDVCVPGWRDREKVRCKVCNEVIAEEMTFDLSAHVVKRLRSGNK
jgi:DNA integrity scanning protein DisA with diadenylate cyclase activity